MNIFKELSLQSKLIFSLLAIAVICVIAGGVNFYTMVTTDKVLVDLKKVTSTRTEVKRFESHIIEVRANLSTFLLSGSVADKESFDTAVQEIDSYFSRAMQIAHLDSTKEALTNIKGHIESWLNDIVAKQRDYMQDPYKVDMARLLVNSKANLELWRKIHAEFTKLNDSLSDRALTISDDMANGMSRMEMFSLANIILVLAVVSLVSFIVVKQISRPLMNLIGVTKKLVAKDWDVRIQGTERTDEIGELAKALQLFRDEGMENERLIEEQKLEDQRELERARKIKQTVQEFRQASSEFLQIFNVSMSGMSTSSQDMFKIADNTSSLSASVTMAANNAGSNVNSVAAATEEMMTSIQEINRQLNSVNSMVADVKNTSETTVDKMVSLESSANDIGGVILMISDIAEQTNLLALNATIEAARAGEAGKGFAVVASEVKNLANETAKATEQVQQRIGHIQAETKEAAEFAKNISKAVARLTESVATIASAMEEQTSVTQEITRSIANASSGTSEVVSNVTQVNTAANDTKAKASDVSKVVDELVQQTGALSTNIDDFIQKIQSA